MALALLHQKLFNMPSIVTYDIPSRHRELKERMLGLGYKDSILDWNRQTVYLPNTTLYHESKTASQVRDDVQQECIKLSINLERCISSQFGPDWAGIYGTPFS